MSKSKTFRSLKYLIYTRTLAWLRQVPLQMEIDSRMSFLREKNKGKDSKNLISFGYKVYSQCDEDGIIAEIFRRICTTNHFFIEIGVGNGLENNTLALLFQNWKGIWIEGSKKQGRAIQKGFASVIDTKDLVFINQFAYAENIDQLLSPYVPEKEIDLLSIDIDGNDYHIFNAIKCCRPRVLIFEYNAKFVPPISYCLKYSRNHSWQHDDCFGMSLKFLETHLDPKGYNLVGCNISGVNAFFVRNDLLGDHFSQPYSAEHHYQPARYFFCRHISGHPPSYSTLNRSMRFPG